MVNTNPAPALPWGVQEEGAGAAAQLETAPSSGEEEDESQQPRQFVTLSDAGLKAGDRIEVWWRLDPDGADPHNRWWGATVEGPDPASSDGRPIIALVYDTHEEFPEERCTVAFTGNHSLLDLKLEVELHWRLQGDATYEPPPADEDEDGGSCSADEGDEEGDGGEEGGEEQDGDEAAREPCLTLQEWSALYDAQGEPSAEEDPFMQRLNSLDPYRQRVVAAGMADFKESLMEFVRQKGEPEITADDVKQWLGVMMSKRRRLG